MQKITRIAILINLPEGKEAKDKLDECYSKFKNNLGKHTYKINDQKEKKLGLI